MLDEVLMDVEALGEVIDVEVLVDVVVEVVVGDSTVITESDDGTFVLALSCAHSTTLYVPAVGNIMLFAVITPSGAFVV